jgi:hypothetical protein
MTKTLQEMRQEYEAADKAGDTVAADALWEAFCVARDSRNRSEQQELDRASFQQKYFGPTD